MEKHHWKYVSKSNYLSATDLPLDGTDLILTVDHIGIDEKVTTERGTSEEQVIYWKEKDYKPMVLNVTNAGTIAQVTGKPMMEDWAGEQVQLYVVDGIKVRGETKQGIRVRKHKPRPVQVLNCTDCGKAITPAMGKDAEWLASYTTKKYGRQLCAECAQKVNEHAAD